MIQRMAKMRIVGPVTLLDQMTELLQNLGVIHLEPSPGQLEGLLGIDRIALDPDHQKRKSELEKLRKDLHDLIALLPDVRLPFSPPKPDHPSPRQGKHFLEEMKSAVDQLQPRVNGLSAQARDCEEEQSLLFKYERVLEAMAPLLQQIQESRELDFIGLVIETEKEAVIEELRGVLGEITGNRFELFLSRVDSKSIAGLLVIHRDLSATVRESLWQENINELKLPASLADRPFGQALKTLLTRRLELPIQIERLRETLRQISFQWRNSLLRFEMRVENRLSQMESAVYFYQTRFAFMVYGWVPERKVSLLIHRVSRVFRGKIVAERMKMTREEIDQVPVALENPPLIRPFETFVRSVSLPRYGSVDPTPFLAFFFPLFFGMILGDVGYGIIILAFSIYAGKKWGNLLLIQNLSAVFVFASLSSILFGFLYGEFFGDLGIPIGIHPIWLNRMEGFIVLIKVSLGLGGCHLFLGMALGVMTAIRRRETKEVWVKGAGMIFVTAVLMILAGTLGGLSSFFARAGLILAVAAFFVILSFGGVRSLMELHNIVNLLSYLRLMGIGTASAALAFAANTVGRMSENVILGMLAGSILHLINLLFGIFSPAIQSLRLHYVEFFGNFFQPGGLEYRPFKKIKRV
jgi:V/A-type H+-transporting ATPase subunit I